MDTKEAKVAYPIFVALGLLVLVFVLLTMLDTCNSLKQPSQVKVDTTYIIKHDTTRIVDVKYKPRPAIIIRDTTQIRTTDTAYITFNDTVLYFDTIKVKNGKVIIGEMVHQNQIKNRELSVDCYNSDTIIKIEKETIIRKNALVKVIPGVFAWGSVMNNNWGAGVNLQGLFADRYLLGVGYDIKNQGIQGNFGVKISLKRK